MYIFAVNFGSSSLKVKVFETSSCLTTIFEARAEHLNSEKSTVTVKNLTYKETLPTGAVLDHKMALNVILNYLVTKSVISSLNDISCVGHRVVHGGTFFSEPMLITDEVMRKIDECSILAPLHNPVNIMGIECCKELLPKIPQVAVFDTAFHQTIPYNKYSYAIPAYLSNEGIRKYGFHGTSYAYLSRTLSDIIGGKDKICAIMAHIGQGASVCAVKQGKSVYTTMEFSPLSGCIMGTRSGSIDPAVVQYLCNNYNYTVDEVLSILNSSSGLFSICGSNNMLEILDGMQNGKEECILAFDMFCDSIAENIAKCAFHLWDFPRQIVFSGGIGENSDIVREEILKRLPPHITGNIYLDMEANRDNSIKISCSKSAVNVYVIPANEEWEIAKEASELLTELNLI